MKKITVFSIVFSFIAILIFFTVHTVMAANQCYCPGTPVAGNNPCADVFINPSHSPLSNQQVCTAVTCTIETSVYGAGKWSDHVPKAVPCTWGTPSESPSPIPPHTLEICSCEGSATIDGLVCTLYKGCDDIEVEAGTCGQYRCVYTCKSPGAKPKPVPGLKHPVIKLTIKEIPCKGQ